MAKVVCLLLSLAVILHTAYSLSCYNCNADNTDTCLKSNKPATVKCGDNTATHKSVCLYRYVVDKDKKTSVNSSCELIGLNEAVTSASVPKCRPAGTLTADMIKTCTVCDTELCNSAHGISFNFMAVLLAPVMYFVSRLVLH